MVLVLLYLDRDGRLADTACWRRCHASIKSRQTSPTGDERHNRRKSGPSRPTASMRVSSPPVGTIPSASDVTDTANPNSKPRSSSRVVDESAAVEALLILGQGTSDFARAPRGFGLTAEGDGREDGGVRAAFVAPVLGLMCFLGAPMVLPLVATASMVTVPETSSAGDEVRYVAAAGERNALQVRHDYDEASGSSWTFSDAGAFISPGRSCTAIDEHTVKCVARGARHAKRPLRAATV